MSPTPLDDRREHRAALLKKWSTYRCPVTIDGVPVLYAAEIEARMDVDPATLPCSGVISDWYLRETSYAGIAIIGGRCLMDTKGRGFEGGPITTSVIVKIENGYAVTLNSVYRLLDDGESDAYYEGKLDLSEYEVGA